MENNELLEKIKVLEQENQRLNAQLSEDNENDRIAREFFENFPIAENFVDEICDCLDSDLSLVGMEGLNKALATVLANKVKTPESFARDNDFLENFIFNNSAVKDRIIKDYLTAVSNSPKICAKGCSLPVTEREKPKDVRSAGELARALFKRK